MAWWRRGGSAGVNAEVFCFSQPSGQVTTTSSKVWVVAVVVTVTWCWVVVRGGAFMAVTGSLSRMLALSLAGLEMCSKMRLYVDATTKLPDWD